MHYFRSLSILLLLCLAVDHSIGQDRFPPGMNPVKYVSPMDTVGDFTIITTERDTFNLYSELAEGKTVFLDLFYTRCGFCQLYAPIIEAIYQDTGAGEGEILFWGITNDPYDTDPVIDAYKTEFGVTNPCAGPQGGGIQALTTIIAGQNFLGYPTYCVVCPDRTMFFDPCYPPDTSCFDPFFEYCGNLVGIKEDETEPSWSFSIYPNPTQGSSFLKVSVGQEIKAELQILDLCGRILSESVFDNLAVGREINLDLSSLPEGLYLIRIIPQGFPTQSLKVMVNR